tara:strand:+ start:1752 stop:2495 length:744 start_codon:yes stop_codon:yes gene_type:complete
MAYNKTMKKKPSTSRGQKTGAPTLTRRRSSRNKKTEPFTSTVSVAGQMVDRKENSEKVAILGAIEKLSKLQISKNYGSKKSTTGADAIKFLDLLGVTVCVEPFLNADFSLLQIQTQEETYDNPNIFDEEKVGRRQKEYPTAIDKFPTKEDPFYELDDRPSDNLQNIVAQEEQMEQEAIAPVELGIDIATVNTNDSYEEQLAIFTAADNADSYASTAGDTIIVVTTGDIRGTVGLRPSRTRGVPVGLS